METLLEEARQANGDAAVWDAGLRRRLIRALVSKGHPAEVADGIARAFERKPMFVPMRPPRNT
jgi:hypothetical protein